MVIDNHSLPGNPAHKERMAEAQTAVLGSMLIDERCVKVLMRQLSPEDFPDSLNRHVFEAMRSLWLEQAPVDPVTVLDRLGSKEYASLLSELMDLTPTAANCEVYARILREERQIAAIQDACRKVVFAETLSEAMRYLSQAAMLLVSDGSVQRASYAQLLADYVDRQKNRTPQDFLDFGMEEINRQVHISPGRFVVIGADSSVGKTAFALQLARNIARSGKKVGFYSYETSLEDSGDRLAANAADIRLAAAKERQLTAAELYRAEAELDQAVLTNLEVIEAADFTVDDIRADTLAKGFQVIFIDYAQLIPTNYAEAKDAVSYVSKSLHRMSQQLHVTVIALSQVTVPERKVDGSRRYITKEDLRESKQLKIDAEAVLLLDMWDTRLLYGDRILIVGKNKDGGLGIVRLKFEPEYMRFSYLPPEDESKRNNAGKKRIDYQTRFQNLSDGEAEELPF